MSPKLPKDFANMAELAATVAQSWKANYATYTVKFVDFDTLLQKANDFRNTSVLNATNDSVRKSNTQALKLANQEITNAVKVLRRYIQGEYATLKDFSAHYSAYGLEPIGTSKTYSMPIDNDRRKQRLSILVSKLENPSDPFHNKEYGFAYFSNLKQSHDTAWENVKNLSVNKSVSSHDTRTAFEQIKVWLQKLKAQIKIDFDKSELENVYKNFGFSN